MKTPKPIWVPSAERIACSDLSRFATALGFSIPSLPADGHESYRELWRWSVANRERFWQDLWRFSGVRARVAPSSVLADDGLPGARWFPDARLNYAEHLLRDGRAPALIARNESGRRVELSRRQLNQRVAGLAQRLRDEGVDAGDRVAGVLPNTEHALIAMLATTSLGAIWSSCSPDFGERGILERFGQIQPKVLLACDGYRYGGKPVIITDRIDAIAGQLDSLRRVVMVPYADQALGPQWPKGAVAFDDYVGRAPLLEFAAVSFRHPLFIMYSSGTTGEPKCIVHGHGGTLLQHLKEHALHGDTRPGDRVFFFTTCGWMMWNWLASALAVGATLVLYDGSPFWPGPQALWELAEEERLTHFGTSPKYLSALHKNGHRVGEQHDLSALRTIYSTGSPLAPEQFDYVYSTIKADLQLASISGGTDLISCFALGNPWSPVWRGELQGPGLGMAVDVFNDRGKPVRGRSGELVCTRSFPSMPVAFWNDADGGRYRRAYFERFRLPGGDGVWHHGDYATMTKRDTLVIHGRSDATLNPGGVRIGTAEIYHVVESLPEIAEAVAVGHVKDGEERVILFVVPRDGGKLDVALDKRIRAAIRRQLTPRHVPHRVLACPEVPRTISGKITELAVRELIHGRRVRNSAALANPGALEFFRRLDVGRLD